jgi:cytochrome c-type biogenesis protein CcmH
MMLGLILLALSLAAAGLWFLTRPLTRAGRAESREDFHQLQIVRDRLLTQLNEIDLEERDRNMDAPTAADERLRVEAELADVLTRVEAVTPATAAKPTKDLVSTRWRWIVVALALAVPSVATGLYFFNATVPLGELEQVAAAPATAAGMPDPMQMVARLEARLQQNPDDVAGWLRLGRSYVVLGRTEEALGAYSRAYPLLPKDFQAESADQLWFLGLAAYRRGEGARAVAFWQTLLQALPPEEASAQQLKHAIAEARKRSAPADQKSQQ